MSSSRIVLFDLGGVLADLGEPAKSIGLELSEDGFWDVWLNSDSVHAFERGEMETREFLLRIAGELGLAAGAEFEERFRNWHLSLFPGAEAMIRDVPDDCRVALLSNTNTVHWEQVVSATEIFATFDVLFLSYETGHYKPAVEAFEQVVAHFDCEPADVLFLDDSSRNVDAAISFGFEAYQSLGVDAAAAFLNSKLGGTRNVD